MCNITALFCVHSPTSDLAFDIEPSYCAYYRFLKAWALNDTFTLHAHREMLFASLAFLQAIAVAQAQLQNDPQQVASIPSFVTIYGKPKPFSLTWSPLLNWCVAPLVYLDQNELYLPSDIQAQLDNTYPALNYTALPEVDRPSPFLLSDLEQLNIQGNCLDIDNCNLYLTSKDNITANPAWLYGVLPNSETGETVGAKSCAIIINDHGSGIVDVYYMYFYAFNLGETALGQVIGDHVGDWEHSMVRFKNGTPISVWLSQHDVS